MTNTQKCREAADEIYKRTVNDDGKMLPLELAYIIERVCFPEPARVDVELLNCPCCSSNLTSKVMIGNDNFIYCTACGIRTSSYPNMGYALDKWNTRA